MASLPDELYRYTTLPVLLDILARKSITLISPTSWEDRNDAHYLERYKATKKLKTLLAVCFTTRNETFHHWRIFSSGSSGVCIDFDANLLLPAFVAIRGIMAGPVVYKYIVQLQRRKPRIDQWPFLKRKPFDDEREFRILYKSEKEELDSLRVPFDLAAIRKIHLSPWLPRSISESIIQIAKSIDGCKGLKIQRSSLLETRTWREAIK